MMRRLRSTLVPQFIKEKIKRTIICNRYRVKLHKNVTISLDTQINGKVVINRNCNISGSYIGLGTFIAPNSQLIQAKIGKFCSIGQNVHTRFGLHPSRKFVSTHPAFFSLQKRAGFTFVTEQCFEEHKYVDKKKKYFVEIGNDVWIGNDVRIMDGIRIGDGAIIGLGSIVTKNIEPYSINVGIPSKKIGYRFNEEQREFLLDFQWWNRDIKWIRENAYLFQDIAKFMKKYQKEYVFD